MHEGSMCLALPLPALHVGLAIIDDVLLATLEAQALFFAEACPLGHGLSSKRNAFGQVVAGHVVEEASCSR